MQGSLPSGGHTEVVVAAAVAPAVDVEAVLVEAPDEDVVSERVDARGAGVDVAQQVYAPDRLVAGQRPHELDGHGRRLEVGEELLLLTPRLRRGVRHDALADHVPAAGDLLVAGEGLALLGVPAALLAVEVAPLQLTDVEQRHLTGAARHEHVVVALEPLEGLPVGERLLEVSDLFLAVGEASGSADLLGGEEVVAEDLTGEGEVGRLGGVSADQRHELGLEVATLTDQALGAVLVGAGLFEGILHEAVDVLALRGRDLCSHRRSPSVSIRQRTVTAGLGHEAGASNSTNVPYKALTSCKNQSLHIKEQEGNIAYFDQNVNVLALK